MFDLVWNYSEGKNWWNEKKKKTKRYRDSREGMYSYGRAAVVGRAWCSARLAVDISLNANAIIDDLL